jgi:hypothetical protein
MMRMLEFLIDNIFVSFGGTLFQQVVGIPMGTNCAPLLAALFLYSYESEFLQKLELREADTICRRSWYIAAHIWKIYDFKIEVKNDADEAVSVVSLSSSSGGYRNYSDFLKRHLHLRNRLPDQGYQKIRSLKKGIFRYQDLVKIYSVSEETMINDAFSYSENV